MTVHAPVSLVARTVASRPGLLARLLGERADGELAPVLANLTLLFNTRAGDSAAAQFQSIVRQLHGLSAAQLGDYLKQARAEGEAAN